MSVTLSEVKRAARAHRAPLAGESAGYLVLAIADQVLQAPRLVQASDVQLTEDGALRVLSGRASSEEDAELSLRRALDQLLLVASSGSAALTRASRRTAPVGLSALVRELESALIPVNRSAARRALSRLHRETARALESGNLPSDDEAKAEPAPSNEPIEILVPVLREPPRAEPDPEPEAQPHSQAEPLLELDPEQDLETPARIVPVSPAVMPQIAESHLDGVVTALCDALPAPPQFVESDALTSALAVQSVPPPVAEAEPETLLEVEIEFEPDAPAEPCEIEATDAVDSSAAPTVMRAVEVAPVPTPLPVPVVVEYDDSEMAEDDDSECETQALSFPVEALTKPEPVVLRRTLRPLLDLLPKPSEPEPLPETPTLGTLAAQLPILAPEQIAEMSVAANLARELALSAAQCADHTERMPEVQPLAPGVAMVESKKSDVKELLSAFQVAEPDVNPGLCRAIKEMAELDLTPAPFAALIR